MKELSIKEKAKRYDEAIERARNYYNATDSVADAELIELIFPELKESENERIIKWIIENIQETLDVDGFFEGQKTMAKNAIAWLEEQGNKDMGISDTTKQKLKDNLDNALEKETPESWNEFLDEQKPADKIEPKFKVGDEIKNKNKESLIINEESFTITRIDRWGYWSEDLFICNFDDTDKWELVEQKSANKVEPNQNWSEDDDSHIHNIIGFIEECKSYNPTTENTRVANFEINWLKSLKDRVQPKQEWSEEDRLHYMNVLEVLEYVKGCKSDYDKIEAVKSDIAWFKFLKDRYTWKPSESDIRILEQVINGTADPINYHATLYAILEQLKKLREE